MVCLRVYCTFSFEIASIKQPGGARFAVLTEVLMNIGSEGMWRCIGWQMPFRRDVLSPSSSILIEVALTKRLQLFAVCMVSHKQADLTLQFGGAS
jgi:hypothetical protein